MSIPQNNPWPKVGIVVLNYKNYEDTVACLRSLARSTYPHVETIVVDNDSQNDSLEHVGRFLSFRSPAPAVIGEEAIETSDRISTPIILLQSSGNRGYAAGNNLGIRVALKRRADYVLILNNDTEVAADFLEPLVQYLETHGQVGAVGPKVLDEAGGINPACARRRPTPGEYFFRNGMGKTLFPNNRWIRRHYYRGEYSFDRPREVDILSGCCMLIRSGVFGRIGLLDENTFLSLEEFILHEKLRGAGLSSAIVPASAIVHKHGRSIARVPSEFVRNAARASFRYYLAHYRGYGRFAVAAILLSLCTPKSLGQMLRKDRGKTDVPGALRGSEEAP
jgi:GT2 family glycosyltransferase